MSPSFAFPLPQTHFLSLIKGHLRAHALRGHSGPRTNSTRSLHKHNCISKNPIHVVTGGRDQISFRPYCHTAQTTLDAAIVAIMTPLRHSSDTISSHKLIHTKCLHSQPLLSSSPTSIISAPSIAVLIGFGLICRSAPAAGMGIHQSSFFVSLLTLDFCSHLSVSLDPYVKVNMYHGKKRVCKKKTHVKKCSPNPVFNELFVFDLPSDEGLRDTSVELLLMDSDAGNSRCPNTILGRLVLGTSAAGTPGEHWREICDHPRRQIAKWHGLSED